MFCRYITYVFLSWQVHLSTMTWRSIENPQGAVQIYPYIYTVQKCSKFASTSPIYFEIHLKSLASSSKASQGMPFASLNLTSKRTTPLGPHSNPPFFCTAPQWSITCLPCVLRSCCVSSPCRRAKLIISVSRTKAPPAVKDVVAVFPGRNHNPSIEQQRTSKSLVRALKNKPSIHIGKV